MKNGAQGIDELENASDQIQSGSLYRACYGSKQPPRNCWGCGPVRVGLVIHGVGPPLRLRSLVSCAPLPILRPDELSCLGAMPTRLMTGYTQVHPRGHGLQNSHLASMS